MSPRALLTLALLALLAHAAPAQDTDGWKTILATEADLKDYPKGQAELQDGLLHTHASFGLWQPQPSPDGAIRARLHFLEGTGFPQLRIRHSGDPTGKNASFYQLMLYIRPGEKSVSQGQVTAVTQGKGRLLGTFPLPQPFALGDTLDLEFSILGDHLQVLANDKLAYEIHDTTHPGGDAWSVASLEAWFSHIQVRTFAPSPQADAGAPRLSKTTDPRILQLQQAYTAALARDITPGHQAALQSLDARYTAALDRALEVATQTGNLDNALALRAEKKRIADHAPLPAADVPTPEPLNTLRLTYRSSLSQLTAQRDQRLHPLREKYLQALQTYQDDLTRAQNLDAALAVKKFRQAEAAALSGDAGASGKP